MKNTPMNSLVSVLMPCYNAASTLGMALASLQAQTYTNWECIIVDDGSVDRPEEVVERFSDSRIRYLRLDANKGRSFARNLSVSMAKGDLLTMVDADDWIYPDKFERQVEILMADQSLAVVSTGIGIVDSDQHLTGVRGQGHSTQVQVFYGKMTRLEAPPIAFAPSMYRVRDIEGRAFNVNYSVGGDFDYLLKLMLGRCYAVIQDVKYIYTEWDSISLLKVLAALGTVSRVFTEYNDNYPARSRYLSLKTLLKVPVYWGAYRVGLWRTLVARRSRLPKTEDMEKFSVALDTVRAKMSQRIARDTMSPPPAVVPAVKLQKKLENLLRIP